MPTPTVACAPNAVNLVQNPSFELVSGPPDVNGMWPMLDTNATTQVPFWTRTETSSHPPVGIINGSQYGLPQVGSQGPRYGYTSSYVNAQDQVQGFTGTLSIPTSVGATYLLSVAVNALSLPIPTGPTFEARLRNGGTGAESAPLVSAAIPFTPNWALVTGAVTANTTYDQVVLRYRAAAPETPWWGIVDDVHLCQAALVTPPPTPTNVPIATSRPTSAPTRTCAIDAPNLVQNPGFESVTGTPYTDFYGFGGWWVYEPSGIDLTQVTGWTRTKPSANGPLVVNNGTPGAPQTAFQGSRYVTVASYQGIIGTLSAATITGATYVLSAQVGADAALGVSLLEVRLRNSASGAESAPMIAASALSSGTWTLVSGDLNANASYDRIVLRYPDGAGSGSWIADDVHVCRATDAPNPPWWTIGGAGVLLVLGGVIMWKRRMFVPTAGGGRRSFTRTGTGVV